LAAEILRWLHLAVVRYLDPAPAVHSKKMQKKFLIHSMRLFQDKWLKF